MLRCNLNPSRNIARKLRHPRHRSIYTRTRPSACLYASRHHNVPGHKPRLHESLRCTFPHKRFVGSRAAQQFDRTHQRRFASTGFARNDTETRGGRNRSVAYQRNIDNMQFVKHRKTPALSV
jgi:hypothetical protein